MVSTLTSYSSLLLAGAAFSLTIFLYMALGDLYSSISLPAWLNGDVLRMMLGALLTGALVASIIGVFTAAMPMPYELLGDSLVAISALCVAGFIAWLVHRVLLGLVNPGQKV